MPPKQLARVLAVRLDNIGDVVMLGPSVRALRAALPQARITLLCSPAGSQAAPLLPWIDDVVVHRALWQDASNALNFEPRRELELVEALRAGRYDAAFIFTSFSQTPYPAAYACYLAGIPVRVGQSSHFGGGVLSLAVKPLADSAHQVDRNLHLLEAWGLTGLDQRLEVQVPEADQAAADELLRARGVDPLAPFVALAPAASCLARTYPPERFAEAARLIGDASRLPVVALGGARDVDACRRMPAISLAAQTSVPVLAGIIRRATLLLGNDSGPMHIADGLGTPLVVAFSGTELESQWQPRSASAVLLRRATTCSPCYQLRCPYGLECLDLTPEEVAQAALTLLPTAVSV